MRLFLVLVWQLVVLISTYGFSLGSSLVVCVVR